jgi:hypothetical protein
MDYWEECIREAFDDAKIEATDKQIEIVAGWVESSHEYYGAATGLDVASDNWESSESKELKRMKAEIKKQQQWELNTTPCKTCTTTGWIKDGFGRDVRCFDCRGKGRI